MEVLAEKLVVSGQSVLTLIAELKRLTLLTDLPALNSMVAARKSEHDAARSASEQSLEALAAQRLGSEVSSFSRAARSTASRVACLTSWTSRMPLTRTHHDRILSRRRSSCG